MARRFAALLLVAGLAAPAAAQQPEPSDPDARKHWRRGKKLFQQERYDGAAVEFWAGWAIEPFSPFLFAWAQAERFAGDCTTAVALYRRFLADKPPPEQAEYARNGMRQCRGKK